MGRFVHITARHSAHDVSVVSAFRSCGCQHISLMSYAGLKISSHSFSRVEGYPLPQLPSSH